MTWKIDAAHTELGFSVKHMMISTVRGKFGEFDGQLSLDPAALERSRAEVSIAVGSIDTGVADRDKHLKSADFFDVENHPKMTFRTTSVRQKGSDVVVQGELTIRDVTRALTLEGEVVGPAKDPWGNSRIGFSLTGELDREDFGLKWNQALEAGGVLVGKKVKIFLEAQAVQG